MHPNAEAAAETAEFAGAAGKFWEMHDALFENQEDLELPNLLEMAKALKLSPEKLQAALASHEYQPRVRSDFQGGVRSGVNGTPTLFLNGQRYDGDVEIEELSAAITSLA
jgi:protein-disulfide isomerase